MGQITSGVRSILSHPMVYSMFQAMMGGQATRQALITEHIRPVRGMKILDIGCGPAGILEHLPEVEYWGFDVSSAYIDAAQARFDSRGHFFCQELKPKDLAGLPKFDLVLALGLIHHLDDGSAIELLRLAYDALEPGGRFISIDPCLEAGQNPVARFIIKRDRGQNVRTRDGYFALASTVFSNAKIQVRHTTWVPYTHCIMECQC